MTATEKLKEIEAERLLNDLDYVKGACPQCDGTGHVACGQFIPKCRLCGGDGIAWIKRGEWPSVTPKLAQ